MTEEYKILGEQLAAAVDMIDVADRPKTYLEELVFVLKNAAKISVALQTVQISGELTKIANYGKDSTLAQKDIMTKLMQSVADSIASEMRKMGNK